MWREPSLSKCKILSFHPWGIKWNGYSIISYFYPMLSLCFSFHGHAHTDTHTYRHKENHVHVAPYIYKVSQTAHENMCQWLKKNNQRGTRNVLGWWMSLLLSYWVVKRVEAAERTPLQCVFRQAPPNTPGREPACDSVCWWLIICLHWRYSPSIYFICY